MAGGAGARLAGCVGSVGRAAGRGTGRVRAWRTAAEGAATQAARPHPPRGVTRSAHVLSRGRPTTPHRARVSCGASAAGCPCREGGNEGASPSRLRPGRGAEAAKQPVWARLAAPAAPPPSREKLAPQAPKVGPRQARSRPGPHLARPAPPRPSAAPHRAASRPAPSASCPGAGGHRCSPGLRPAGPSRPRDVM